MESRVGSKRDRYTNKPNNASRQLNLNARCIVKAHRKEGRYIQAEEPITWDSEKTAAVICDMWDRHWCNGATSRVAEMASHMNRVINELRRRGVLIIHAPSDTMDFYKNHPCRRLVQSIPPDITEDYYKKYSPKEIEKRGCMPVDASDEGCMCEIKCTLGMPWTRQIDTIEISGEDVIDDSEDIICLMKYRGIENVIMMGVHTNMCVLDRPFAIRSLVSRGMNTLLMRDLTDSMYNPAMRPYVNHFTGTDLIVWYIEKNWCPTIMSSQIIGGNPFRFREDTRAVLPEFVSLKHSLRHFPQ